MRWYSSIDARPAGSSPHVASQTSRRSPSAASHCATWRSNAGSDVAPVHCARSAATAGMSSGPVRCTRIAAIARRTMPAMSAEHHAPPAAGPCLQTLSGRWVNPFDPDPQQLDIGDMAHPLKHRSPLGAAFKEAEDHLEAALQQHFAIRPDVPEIKRADRALLATERRAFSDEAWHWPELEGVEPLDLELTAMSPDEAQQAFLERYEELTAQR